MSADLTSTTRFSSRVDDYVRYRPGYPLEVLELLRRKCKLTSSMVVADVGAGTGILTELFLESGHTVFAVEPNEPMRLAAERQLETYAGFHSIAATAEATGLETNSVDLIVAGQAFHWFDPVASRAEFIRIGRYGAWTALLWNDRRLDATPFHEDYELLLQQFGIGYQAVNHRNIDTDAVQAFYRPASFTLDTFVNVQILDWDSLLGRLRSSSYVPDRHHPQYVPMVDELRRIFETHQSGGHVQIVYDTLVYCGQL